jgi:hypothetical protein
VFLRRIIHPNDDAIEHRDRRHALTSFGKHNEAWIPLPHNYCLSGPGRKLFYTHFWSHKFTKLGSTNIQTPLPPQATVSFQFTHAWYLDPHNQPADPAQPGCRPNQRHASIQHRSPILTKIMIMRSIAGYKVSEVYFVKITEMLRKVRFARPLGELSCCSVRGCTPNKTYLIISQL